jgi:hypothetical protein
MFDRPLAASLAALCLTTAFAVPALAEDPPAGPTAPVPAPTAPASAQELRDKARTAMTSGDVAGACLLFEQSYQASKGPASGVSPDDALFDLAACHERAGKSAAATAEFGQVAAGSGPRAAEARQRAAALTAPPPASPVDTVPPVVPAAAGTQLPPVVTLTTPQESAPTRLGDFMDTRLSWTFGDDDILHSSGLAQPYSPNFNIGDRKQYRLFFDNLNSRFGGRENLTHLALYKKMPGFIKNLDTEASLVLRFDVASLASNTNNLNQAIYDAGSYIRLTYHTSGGPDGKEGLSLTLWPLDTDRFRLGYLYDISWGGTNASINQSIFPRIQGSAPGAKLQYQGDGWNVYAGFKTASIVQVESTLVPGTSEVEATHQSQVNIGLLAGGAVDLGDYLHLDLGAGYFQQGKFDLPDVQGKPVYTVGGSGRLVAHAKGMPAPQSIDFLLYRNDPNKPQIIFAPEKYEPGKTSWSASIEFSNLLQNLKDFDATGVTKLQSARAAALQANVKSGFLRASLTGIYRDLPFVVRNQPGYIAFESLPAAGSTTNELFFAAATDYYIESLHLTPGVGAGLQLPASFKSTSTDTSSAPIDRTVVVREQGNIAILPLNKGAVPIVQARVSLKWDISPILSAIVWAQYVRDNNGSFLARDPTEGTLGIRTFLSPDFLGFGTSVQARF